MTVIEAPNSTPRICTLTLYTKRNSTKGPSAPRRGPVSEDTFGAEVEDEDSEGEEALALERELSLLDERAPARALAALNALRKSRQHYDTVLVAAGAELPAHRAVLAAASPYLLEALAPPAAAPAAYRVDDVDADALRELVEFAYTGRLRVRDAGAARRLYCAAWRLRMDAVREHLAERLLRRLAPAACLELRALPDLAPRHLAALDAYIARHVSAPTTDRSLSRFFAEKNRSPALSHIETGTTFRGAERIFRYFLESVYAIET